MGLPEHNRRMPWQLAGLGISKAEAKHGRSLSSSATASRRIFSFLEVGSERDYIGLRSGFRLWDIGLCGRNAKASNDAHIIRHVYWGLAGACRVGEKSCWLLARYHSSKKGNHHMSLYLYIYIEGLRNSLPTNNVSDKGFGFQNS